jgi:hypothetical protein
MQRPHGRAFRVQVVLLFPAMNSDSMWSGLQAAVSPAAAHEYTAQARADAEATCSSVMQYLHAVDADVAQRQRDMQQVVSNIAAVVTGELYTCQLCDPPSLPGAYAHPRDADVAAMLLCALGCCMLPGRFQGNRTLHAHARLLLAHNDSLSGACRYQQQAQRIAELSKQRAALTERVAALQARIAGAPSCAVCWTKVAHCLCSGVHSAFGRCVRTCGHATYRFELHTCTQSASNKHKYFSLSVANALSSNGCALLQPGVAPRLYAKHHAHGVTACGWSSDLKDLPRLQISRVKRSCWLRASQQILTSCLLRWNQRTHDSHSHLAVPNALAL